MNAFIGPRVKVIANSHTESKKGAVVRVDRLELSRAGTELLTSTSSSISGEDIDAENLSENDKLSLNPSKPVNVQIRR